MMTSPSLLQAGVFTLQSCPAPEARSEASVSRARFHSLDSSVALNTASKTAERPAQVRSASASESPLQDSSHAPTVACPTPEDILKPPLLVPPNTTTGSIAIRAMRSMRSVARLANWSNGKPIEKDTLLPTQSIKKHKQSTDAKKSKKTEKRDIDSGRHQMTSRLSGSSSEAGMPANVNTPHIQASTARKHNVLGLGFPSGFHFGTMRSSSAESSSQITTGSENALSLACRGRSSSTMSAASSLKPMSAKSRISSASSASVKWVEERLETVKVACRRERASEQRDETTQYNSQGACPRGAIVDVFPEHTSAQRQICAVEVDEHLVPGSEPMATPRRQTRVRPASDQMVGKERLGSIRHDSDGESRTTHI